MQELTYSEFAKASFFTSPEWRFDRATELINMRQRRSSLLDDQITKDNYSLLKLQAAKTPADHLLSGQMRNLAIAHRLRRDNRYKILKLEVECRILAGLSLKRICQTVGLSEEVLQAYAQTFFDVQDRLESEPYIHSMVLCSELGKISKEHEGLLRLFSYAGGIAVFETLMLTWRCERPVSRVGLMQRIGTRVQAEDQLRRLFTSGSQQPICQTISALLSQFRVHVEDIFPDDVETSNAEYEVPQELEEAYRAVG